MTAKQNWILVGGDSLLGREIRDLLATRELPVVLRLCSASKDERVLTEDEGELALIEPLEAETLAAADVLLLAGGEESAGQALAQRRALKRRPVVIDLTGGCENLPESLLRAPVLDAGTASFDEETIHTIVHPAASALARLLLLVHATQPIRHAVATIFEPASARGQKGVEELHRQTASLFSFQSLPREVFDAQASFNLLPRLGSEATQSLAESELRIEKHLASMLGASGVPLPSIRLVQAPVFHGYCQSVWIEFETRPPVQLIEKCLGEGGVDVRQADMEPASNAGVAGQSGLTVSDIQEDRTRSHGLWLWLASDNLRTTAENAILAAAMAAQRKNG